MENLKNHLDPLKLGRAQAHQNMALFPLLASDAGAPYYMTLEEAFEQGNLEVREKDQAGSVPELLLINQGPMSVLIVAGEELVGAKQNRIVNATFLIQANTEVILPVSCVEQGRWAYRSEKFSSGKRMMHASLRSAQHRDVMFNRRAMGGGFRADQGRIWADLDDKIESMAASAPSQAMSDLFESQRDHLSEYLKAFRLVECQVGGIFAINGKVVGLDLYGYQDTFEKFFERIVNSYALDALDWRQRRETPKPNQSLAKNFLDEAIEAPVERGSSLGLGEDIRIQTDNIVGAGLEHDGELLQLSAFMGSGNGNPGRRVGFRRFSSRREMF